MRLPKQTPGVERQVNMIAAVKEGSVTPSFPNLCKLACQVLPEPARTACLIACDL